jgi:hypothetical protein
LVLGAAEEREQKATGYGIKVILEWGIGRDTMGNEGRRYAPRVFLPPQDG